MEISEIVKQAFQKIVLLDLNKYLYEIRFDDSDQIETKEISELILKMNILQIKELITELNKRVINFNIYNLEYGDLYISIDNIND